MLQKSFNFANQDTVDIFTQSWTDTSKSNMPNLRKISQEMMGIKDHLQKAGNDICKELSSLGEDVKGQMESTSRKISKDVLAKGDSVLEKIQQTGKDVSKTVTNMAKK